MLKKRWSWLLSILSICFLVGLFNAPVHAQSAQLRIINTDVSKLPTVELTVFALDAQNNPVNPTGQFISVKHNETAIDAEKISVAGTRPVGTFTVFLLDLPPGIDSQLNTIQESIETFSASPYMEEQIDSVAIYRVDERAATEVLPPSIFHNEVRNFFALGLNTQAGPTALFNSLGDLLTQVNGMKPRPEMVASIVVFSDGTDSVSANYAAEDIGRIANEQGVGIHTVWLENSDLFNQAAGQENLLSWAAQTGGAYSELTNASVLNSTWSRISAFRNFLVLNYTLDEVLPGTYPVEIGFPDIPNFPVASGEVTIPNSLPTLALDIPETDRALVLADPNTPIALKFPATLAWMDNQDHSVQDAQLFVNGVAAQAIPLDAVNDFTSDPIQLIEGDNVIQMVIVDDAGTTAQSAPLILNVTAGEADQIPAALQPSNNSGLIRNLLLGLLLIALLAGAYVLFQTIKNRLNRPASEPPRIVPPPPTAAAQKPQTSTAFESQETRVAGIDEDQYAPPVMEEEETLVSGFEPTDPELTSPYAPKPKPKPQANAKSAVIEVLESVSQLTPYNPIDRPEYLIGRSPTVDLSFPNDSTVSRIHATIVRDGDIYRIYDEQSTSGVYVNDREVPEYGLQLSDGDEIHLGAVHLRFRQPK